MIQIFLLLCEALIFLYPKGTSASVSLNREEANLSNATLISYFLENLLDIGFKSLRGSYKSEEFTPVPTVRRCDKYVLELLIQNKVNELRPMLQDNDYKEEDPDDNLTLKGEDETTIVELVSGDKKNLRKKETFKDSIRKYKRLKRTIYKALIKESVSNETVELIISTIDGMIAKMISNKCSWKREWDNENVLRITEQHGGNANGLPAAWNSEWHRIQEKYSDLFQNNKSLPHERLNVAVKSLMEKLPSFFDNIFRDGEMLAKEYNVRCHTVNATDRLNRVISDDNDSYGRSALCKTKMWKCSGELRHFLMHAYKSIHTVTLKVLNDYLEMYKIDVNIDKQYGHKGIVARLKEIRDDAANEVCNIYVKLLEYMHMDKDKSSDTFVNDMLYLINNITEKMIIQTNKIIRNKMKPMDSELKERILTDINGYVQMELEHISDKLKMELCPSFQTCNGRYTIKNTKRSQSAPNGVFVRVVVKLDDQMNSGPHKNSKRPHSFGANGSSVKDKHNVVPNNTLTKAPFTFKKSKRKMGKPDKKALSVTRTTKLYNSSNKMKQFLNNNISSQKI